MMSYISQSLNAFDSNNAFEKSVKRTKNELERLNALHKQCAEADELLDQLSVASHLKAEGSFCFADRRPPIESRLQLLKLSSNRALILIHIENNSSSDLINWILQVEIGPASDLFMFDAGESDLPNSNICLNSKLAALRKGNRADIEFYYDDELRPVSLVRCYLIKIFTFNRRSADRNGVVQTNLETKTFQILIKKFLINILDYIYPTNVPLLFSSTADSYSETVGVVQTLISEQNVKFNFALSFVRLISLGEPADCLRSACKYLVRWMFPQLSNDSLELSDAPDNKHEYKLEDEVHFDQLSLDSHSYIKIKFALTKSKQILCSLSINGPNAAQSAVLIRKAVNMKYLFFINDFLNIPKQSPLDNEFSLELLQYFQSGLEDSNIDNFCDVKCLFDSVLHKLPFA